MEKYERNFNKCRLRFGLQMPSRLSLTPINFTMAAGRDSLSSKQQTLCLAGFSRNGFNKAAIYRIYGTDIGGETMRQPDILHGIRYFLQVMVRRRDVV
jgi:hypothetical protein